MFHMKHHGNNILAYSSKYINQPIQAHVHSRNIAPARLEVTHIHW
jgi:hypothetical protein